MNSKLISGFLNNFKRTEVEEQLSGIDRLLIVKELLEILKMDENGLTFEAGIKAFELSDSEKFLKFKKEVLLKNSNNKIINNRFFNIGDFNASINRSAIIEFLDFFARELVIEGATEELIVKVFEETGVMLNKEVCTSTIISMSKGILSEEVLALANNIKALEDNLQIHDSLNLPDGSLFLTKHCMDIANRFSLATSDIDTISSIMVICIPDSLDLKLLKA